MTGGRGNIVDSGIGLSYRSTLSPPSQELRIWPLTVQYKSSRWVKVKYKVQDMSSLHYNRCPVYDDCGVPVQKETSFLSHTYTRTLPPQYHTPTPISFSHLSFHQLTGTGIEQDGIHYTYSVKDLGCLSRILILLSRIPDLGSKRHRIPDPELMN